MGGFAPPSASVLEQLEKVLASEAFRAAGRSSRLLRFLVERTLSGHAEGLKEYTIGAEALDRGDAFDPRIDSIARVEVSREETPRLIEDSARDTLSSRLRRLGFLYVCLDMDAFRSGRMDEALREKE